MQLKTSNRTKHEIMRVCNRTMPRKIQGGNFYKPIIGAQRIMPDKEEDVKQPKEGQQG